MRTHAPSSQVASSGAANYMGWPPTSIFLIFCSWHLRTDVRKADGLRSAPSSYFSVHLQRTSSWHFQSGLALTKTISYFALKKWLT